MESLARGGPWLLGTIRKGSSDWRSLSEAESENHGGSALRRLYGCVVSMFHPDKEHILGSSCSFNRADKTSGPCGLFEQLLLTWSQVS